ncbi:MAG: hypothetical protein QOK37_4624 [Thermoanaerobaculia bacterium]|jgi:hypothetical protein|nr:hypothetical protein [Thermoanaerobaculia bacterium]
MATMQRVYAASIGFAAALSVAALAGIAVLLRASEVPDGGDIALGVMPIILAFLLLNVALRLKSGAELCMPGPRRVHGVITFLSVVIGASWFATGLFRWPAAPVVKVGSDFRDKRGALHTPPDYISFRKWEATLPLAGLPFALVAITALPATGKSRRLRIC